jgi:hypothetical protein
MRPAAVADRITPQRAVQEETAAAALRETQAGAEQQTRVVAVVAVRVPVRRVVQAVQASSSSAT